MFYNHVIYFVYVCIQMHEGIYVTISYNYRSNMYVISFEK